MNRYRKKSPGRVNQGLKTSERWKPTHKCSKIKKAQLKLSLFVLEAGLEPARPKEHRILSPACLPIPPLEHLFYKEQVDKERETGFEPATPTLARLCSTN